VAAFSTTTNDRMPDRHATTSGVGFSYNDARLQDIWAPDLDVLRVAAGACANQRNGRVDK